MFALLGGHSDDCMKLSAFHKVQWLHFISEFYKHC